MNELSSMYAGKNMAVMREGWNKNKVAYQPKQRNAQKKTSEQGSNNYADHVKGRKLPWRESRVKAR